jgi:hypothetical protein
MYQAFFRCWRALGNARSRLTCGSLFTMLIPYNFNAKATSMNLHSLSMVVSSRISHSLARYKVGLFALVLMAGAGSAVASPYEDVLAGAFRCGPISRSATWLDCYYGAAQPMRDQLGLSPAPATQIQLAKKPPREVLPVEDASERATVMTQAARCDPSSSDRSWLNCYYAAAQSVRGKLGLKPVPQLSNRSGRISSTRSLVPSGAINIKSAPTISVLTSYSFDSHGFFTVRLANGQVWRQLPGDTDYANWREPASHYAVKVSRGMLGSFNLNVTGSSKLFKVERIS